MFIFIRFVKPALLENLTIKSALQLDLTDANNLMPVTKVDLGFSATKTVTRLKAEGKLSELQIYDLRMQTRNFLLKMTEHLRDKLPLKNSLCRNVSCLAPSVILSDSESSSLRKFSFVLSAIETCGWIKADQCDLITQQFREFRKDVLSISSIKQKMVEFQPGIDRLDLFYTEHASSKLTGLWSVLSKLLILSHGQATVERGFSENKELSCTNLQEKTLIAKRIVVDHVKKVNHFLH